MNNLDYIRTLSAEEFLEIIHSGCLTCVYKGENCDLVDNDCREGNLKWLRSEHDDPDSWEKLLADLDHASKAMFGKCKMIGIKRGIGGCSVCEHKDSDCERLAYERISARIRALGEAEGWYSEAVKIVNAEVEKYAEEARLNNDWVLKNSLDLLEVGNA